MTLELRDVRVSFPGGRGISGVSAVLRERSYVGLLGGSGSGKTTLLRVIAGLQAPDSGSLILRGEDITALPPERRGISLVFQSFALFPHLSVLENVEYGLKLRGVPPSERQARALLCLDLAGFADSGARRIETLSGGEQQRVAIARALAPGPRVLLLDEPLANLDAALRVATRERLRELHERVGLITIHVTHDREEALAVADDIMVLHHGTLRQFGSASEVWRRPQDADTAEFLGMTVLEGIIQGGSLMLPGFAPTPQRGARDGACAVGFRPPDLLCAAEGPLWTVARRQPAGDLVEVLLEREGQKLRMRAIVGTREGSLEPKQQTAITFRDGALALWHR